MQTTDFQHVLFYLFCVYFDEKPSDRIKSTIKQLNWSIILIREFNFHQH